ncbi:DnaJ domain containing protein [Histomonas meleagridis]|uniref:DnaJ domain containing protein n=1 Tax=Histomonas meleagridis TaxID=135588 RepID=UPI00355A3067|nr:DnaJ domain containing protein [Histomonas meleagridis]KAH0805395.1 DnaJ domain containing protein [Histomonas meleagridis]
MLLLFAFLAFVKHLDTSHLLGTNLYQIIGLNKGAQERDIARSFKRYLSQKRKNQNPTKKALDSYKLTEFAFDVLGNPDSKALYDMFENNILNATKFQVLGYQSDVALEALKKVFGNLPPDMNNFGGMIIYPVQFNLIDFLTGAERTLSVVRTRDCVCPQGGKNCVSCRKDPLTEQIVRHKIQIPPGAPEFHRIIVKDLGDTASARGACDVIFTVYTAPDPKFKRDGVDVYTDINVSLSDAIRGAEIEIENFDGEKVQIDLKGGIQHGEQRRIHELGLPYFLDNSHRGDLVITFSIEFPKSLTDEQKAIIQSELPDNEEFYE